MAKLLSSDICNNPHSFDWEDNYWSCQVSLFFSSQRYQVPHRVVYVKFTTLLLLGCFSPQNVLVLGSLTETNFTDSKNARKGRVGWALGIAVALYSIEIFDDCNELLNIGAKNSAGYRVRVTADQLKISFRYSFALVWDIQQGRKYFLSQNEPNLGRNRWSSSWQAKCERSVVKTGVHGTFTVKQ